MQGARRGQTASAHAPRRVEVPALSKARLGDDESPLERLQATERRLLEEIRDMRLAAELRRSSIGATAQEIEHRVDTLASSMSVLPETLSRQDEQTVNTLTGAVQTIRADLRTYGMMVGGALALAIVLLLVTIATLAR
jgi:hypothetical protein